MTTEAKNLQQAERDRASLAKIQAGGRGVGEGTAELYKAYRRPFLAYFQRNSMDTGQAEDLLQEVFINVVRRATDFRSESMVSTWMWTIARHKLIDHARVNRPEVTLMMKAGRRSRPVPCMKTPRPAAITVLTSVCRGRSRISPARHPTGPKPCVA